MTLLGEAAIDDEFNSHMNKIQQAIIKLEKLAPRFANGELAPLRSQRIAISIASADLKKIEALMFINDK